MLSHRGLIVDHGMGSGKTRISIILIALLKKPGIVVVPASLQENYQKEILKLAEQVPQLDQSLYHIVSSTSFLNQVPSCQGKVLIVDEGHELRNSEGKISQKILSCALQADKVLIMTGTPLVNRPDDLAVLLNMIVQDKIKITISTGHLGPLWSQTVTFTKIPVGDDFVQNFGIHGLNHTGRELWKKLFPCLFSYYQPPHSHDFPTTTMKEIVVPMSQPQWEIYKKWARSDVNLTMVRMLANSQTVLALQESKSQKLPKFKAYLNGGRRICNAVEIEGHIYAPKFEKMMDILLHSDPHEQVIIFSQFLSRGIQVAEKLLQFHHISYSKFTGQETQTQKKIAVQDYNSRKVRVFLFSLAGGLGLDLKNTGSVYIMEPDWNMTTILQVIGRAVRYKSHDQPGTTVKIYKFYASSPSSLSLSTVGSLLKRWFSSSSSRKRQRQPKKSENLPLITADLYLKNLAQQKEAINQEFLNFAKDWSIENAPVGSCTEENI